MTTTARFIYTQDYVNGLDEHKQISYGAAFDAPLSGSLYGNLPGVPTGAEGESLHGALTGYYFKFDVWDEELDGLFLTKASVYPGGEQISITNLDPNGYFGAVTCVLEIAKGDYLVSGFGGFGRVTNDDVAWWKSDVSGIVSETPCMIATDGASALFVFADQLGSYPGPWEARFHYITVPLSSSGEAVTITDLPYFTLVVESSGDIRYCEPVLGEVMPNFTVAVTNDSGQSSDGRNGTGCKFFIGPAISQPGGGHNFNSFGVGITSVSPSETYGIGSFTVFMKAVGGVIDLSAASSTFSPVANESSIEAIFPASLPNGYEKTGPLMLSGWGFSYATLPAAVFWTNLRLTAAG